MREFFHICSWQVLLCVPVENAKLETADVTVRYIEFVHEVSAIFSLAFNATSLLFDIVCCERGVLRGVVANVI